jgi:hypothetical protein
MSKFLLLASICFISASGAHAQSEVNDVQHSLSKDSASFLSKTFINGYGNAFYQRDFDAETSKVNLERFVLFVGHRFNSKISFYSELEVEDAKVTGGEPGGEVALEQTYLQFNFDPTHYLVAGLFLPRIGILNENHLPNTFNGNERTQVETLIIPSTWRELGVGYYGQVNSSPFYYSVGLMNGLSSADFEHGTGIREGRFEGRNATANNIALTGALQFDRNDLILEVSGYYGGTVGLSPGQADSLQLTSGFFGTPVIIGEADLQYDNKGFSTRILGTVISIPDASNINRAYANNTAQLEYGVYAEVGYNLFEQMKKVKSQQLVAFVRYEKLNINATIPDNGIIDGTLDQQHVIAGLTYFPIKNIAIKADVRLMHTGEQNPDLVINPNPAAPPYDQNNSFLNLGFGFSF